MTLRSTPFAALVLWCAPLAAGAAPASAPTSDTALEKRFREDVRPFVETYCISCHGKDQPEAELDLTPFTHLKSVVDGFAYWELVLERLEAGDMPPAKAKQHPSPAQSHAIVEWLQAVRRHEALKHAGDPGPVLARRLSNAEYDYTIRDLTGVDIRPTREFPVDPANQAGFDNSGESLAMSPALVKKYLHAARTVSEHLVLKPDGFEFAPHPVVADTDRDKWGVLRIVDFYKRQPTDLADYFAAAWRYHHRATLGQPHATLDELAAAARISPRYLQRIWSTLTARGEDVGPIAKLQQRWQQLPAPGPSAADTAAAVRAGCEELRTWVVDLRTKLVPEVKNLTAPGINNGSQTLVLWKNRQMAANRRTFDRSALYVPGQPAATSEPKPVPSAPAAARTDVVADNTYGPIPKAPTSGRTTPDIVRRGGKFLGPAITTTGSSATFAMAAARNRGSDPDLAVPGDPAERARVEAAFARFADVFPDAFFITERARVYMDAQKETENAGRLLSAGLHSMTGYFRDDQPLYDLILDETGRRELDRLWNEFETLSLVPQRMHTSFTWFERTDSSFMRDPEFDPYRPEDKSVTEQAKVRQLGDLYLAKAVNTGATEQVQRAIREHFEIVATNIRRIEQTRLAAEPSHLRQLEAFAARAYRRPLSDTERRDLKAFYTASRADNGLDHEEAMRDSIARVLMSPHFCYRLDEVVAGLPESGPESRRTPLSAHALASRLSYFLWSSMPDDTLLARAAADELRRPQVLATEARRLLADPRARNFITEFAGHWLDFRRFEEHNGVDRERFPQFDPALRTAMFEEPIRFLVDLIQRDGSVLDCLYADHTFVNAPLARHYGLNTLAAHLTEDTWTRTEGTAAVGRGGLLPMAVFLTANSPGLRTSPVKRGYWVVRRVLGERIPAPPAQVPDLPADEAHLAGLTVRQALAKHRDDPACAGCHARFDSFGLVFEGYGAIGERRTKDFGGRLIDARAEFPGGKETEGFEGLRNYIREHRERDFVDNLCRKLLAYALGRSLLLSDDPLVETMKERLAASGHRFSTLVETIVTSPQFLMKRNPAALAKTASTP
jgi:cytochrome c553